MDSMEINKAVAAFLIAGIAFMGAGLISEALVHPKQLKETAIKVDLPSEQTAAAAPAEAEPPVAVLLASAETPAAARPASKAWAASRATASTRAARPA